MVDQCIVSVADKTDDDPYAFINTLVSNGCIVIINGVLVDKAKGCNWCAYLAPT